MSEWGRVPLSRVLQVKHGLAFPGSEFGDNANAPQLLTPGNFDVGGGFRESRPKSFHGDIPAEFVLKPGDLVITMTDLSKDGATLGCPALIPAGKTYLHNQRIGLVRLVEPLQATEQFLNYFLRTDEYRFHILATATGSTVRHTSPSRIADYAAPLPPLDEQRAIAEVLGALDDKIAANGEKSLVAANLAEAQFRFTLENANRQVRRLEQVATIVLGGTPSRERVDYWQNGTVPWLSSGKANEERVMSPTTYITDLALQQSAAKLMPMGTTLIAITGATLGQVARLEIEASGNQSLIGVWNVNPHVNDWLYFAIKQAMPTLLNRATGAAQQHVSKRDLEQLTVPFAPEIEIRLLAEKVGPLLNVAASADRETLTLAATRDALLPQLMSGKLRVRDAERIVSDAV